MIRKLFLSSPLPHILLIILFSFASCANNANEADKPEVETSFKKVDSHQSYENAFTIEKKEKRSPSSESMFYELLYPVIHSDTTETESINEEIQSIVDNVFTIVEDYKNTVEKDESQVLQTPYLILQYFLPEEPIGDVMSIIFYYEYYIGGAHPSHNTISISLNKKTLEKSDTKRFI